MLAANQQDDGSFYVDRSPDMFPYLLSLMRGCKVEDLPKLDEIDAKLVEELMEVWQIQLTDPPDAAPAAAAK